MLVKLDAFKVSGFFIFIENYTYEKPYFSSENFSANKGRCYR